MMASGAQIRIGPVVLPVDPFWLLGIRRGPDGEHAIPFRCWMLWHYQLMHVTYEANDLPPGTQ